MARKKKGAESSAGAPWLNTFADLMNLLLCFFVLLFASSTVDAEKYDMVATSLTSAFSIFSGGGSSINEGQLISSGVSQLNQLDNYYNSMGKAAVSSGENVDATNSTNNTTTNTTTDSSDPTEALMKQNKEASQKTYDKVANLSSQYKLNDLMDVSIDPNFQYVKISLSGSILFESGKAEIKPQAQPIFSKVGDILKVFDTYKIELEGHTDNVPIHNSSYSSNNWLSAARALNAATYLINEKGLDPQYLSWTGRGEYDPVASNSTEEGRSKNRRVEIKIYNDLDK